MYIYIYKIYILIFNFHSNFYSDQNIYFDFHSDQNIIFLYYITNSNYLQLLILKMKYKTTLK